MIEFSFDNSYTRLPDTFYRKINPTAVQAPELIIFNSSLTKELGLKFDEDLCQSSIAVFAGNQLPKGAEPIAMAYAGHQFGGFSPQLGDGRAILLGEHVRDDNSRFDIQLKGSGPTPWSRSGDGRSALGPVLREYLLSEAMQKLGVPTTRALAAVTTGEDVARDTLVPGGIITRIASGFIRVGTFEYFSAQREISAVKQLADYAIKRHYSDAQQADNPYVAFLENIVEHQASLIARWMSVGFIHGVMNTDNMSITGETIDYGPCAFMDDFDHSQVYSSIDRQGRYAYKNQPQIAQWNLVRLAETLLPLFVKTDGTEPENIDEKQANSAVGIAQEILNGFQSKYESYWLELMRHKLGLFNRANVDTENANKTDFELVNDLLDCMQANHADFTLGFYYLSQLGNDKTEKDLLFCGLFKQAADAEIWLKRWRDRLLKESLNEVQRQEKMSKINPVYIPRNHQIEAAIRAAEDRNDFSVFHELHEVLQQPFKIQQGKHEYMLPPRPEQQVLQTFCGT